MSKAKSALECARAHYASLPQGRLEVPEWGEPGKPLVVTWSPLTLLEMQGASDYAARKGGDAGSPAWRLRFGVRLVVLKARAENGDRLFNVGDEDELMRAVAHDVPIRVAAAMQGEANAEDLEKN